MTEIVTAGLLVIGDEILSGRTKDKNIGFIAEYLTNIGIDLREVRVVADDEGDIVAANILGEPREAHYEAVPRVTYTDPQAASVGATDAPFRATHALSDIPKTPTYTRAYADSDGFLTVLSDGERLTGAYALGPEAGEWMQQATLAIRAHVPIDVLGDVAGHQTLPLRVGQHHRDALGDLVHRGGTPRSAGPALRRLGAPGHQVRHQLVDAVFGELLHRQQWVLPAR